jgi:large conductance mechanosensitive channel
VACAITVVVWLRDEYLECFSRRIFQKSFVSSLNAFLIMSKQDEMLEELKQIRQLLEPKPEPPPPPPPQGLLNEFKDFLSKYRVMGLAVAFILGIYLGALINALVDDLIMPIIELAMPGIEWEAITLPYPDGPFRVGHFIGALITFLIVALVIFILVKITKRMGVE